jgi:hypothetical protein
MLFPETFIRRHGNRPDDQFAGRAKEENLRFVVSRADLRHSEAAELIAEIDEIARHRRDRKRPFAADERR